MKGRPILIGIAGGTGSGKTSVACELVREFGPGEVVVLEQDAYYRDLGRLPLPERHRQNFDHPEAVDLKLLQAHLVRLRQGQPIAMPVYDFTTHTRRPQTREIQPHHVVVLEGILVLAIPSLRELLDIRVYVETPADIRFIRRLKRDMRERQRQPESVVRQYLETVRPMHEQFVEQSKLYADLIIPEGGQNTVAVDLLRTKIMSILMSENNRT